MKKYLSLVLFLFYSMTLLAEDSIQLLSEDSPPYNFVKNGKFVGAAVDCIKELQKRVGHKGTIEVLPWNRAYKRTLSTKNTALFLTGRTPARENLFKWVGPIVSDQWGFIARKESNFKISKLDDAKKAKRIGTYLGDVKDEFLKQHGFDNVDTALSNQTNARKLASRRIDLWLTSLVEYQTHLKKEKLDPQDFKVLYKLEKIDLYLAFSLQTEDRIVQKWRIALREMITDGTYEKIFPAKE